MCSNANLSVSRAACEFTQFLGAQRVSALVVARALTLSQVRVVHCSCGHLLGKEYHRVAPHHMTTVRRSTNVLQVLQAFLVVGFFAVGQGSVCFVRPQPPRV